MQHLDYLYAKLVNGLISTLLNELLVLGLFFVFYGYITQIIKKPKLIRSAEFIKRLILLGDVSIFVFYIALTYFMPYANVSFADIVEQARSFPEMHLIRAKLTLLVMSPIDLLSIVVLAGMYASLGMDNFEGDATDSIETEKLDKRLNNLFMLTGIWHFVTVIWWIAFGILTDYGLKAEDIAYHAVFGILHLVGFYFWRRLSEKGYSNWYGIGYYSLLIVTVYSSRIWIYIDRL